MFFKKKKNKIFCISMQRTGTTSVGEFFKKNGFKVADWPMSFKNKWSYHWEQGDFETIFNSEDFKNNQVFEDDPWWLPEFYKVLYHRFPDTKFILLTRDEDAWFKSMLSHSKGQNPGNTKRHCKVYRREEDFYQLISDDQLKDYDEKSIDNLLSLRGYEDHYKTLYSIRNKEIMEFFNKNAPESLFVAKLEDPNKWQKLGEFFNIKISADLEVHANKSNK